MKEVIQNLLKNRLEELLKDRVIETLPIEIRVDHSKDKTQGDFATNIAMVLSKQAKSSPRDLAAIIIEGMAQSDAVKKIEIAGPGFINFFLSADANFKIIEEILEAGSHFGLSKFGADTRILIEFVSANPTGPLHVGHGRGAAYGATVANLLRSQGYSVDCEYYVNDAGRQMDILAVSVYLRYINSTIFPVNGYQGSYILDIAKQIKDLPEVNIFKNVSPDETEGGDKEKHIDDLISNCKELLGNEYLRLHDFACNQILQDIRKDLEEFHVVFEKWFSEKSLETNQLAPKIIDKLKQSDDIYEKNGALWFNTEKYGDEKDRVVVRENGLHTYFASDIAYHYEKYSRGYDEIINIWGADHHGYIPRVKASISSLGLNPEKLKVLLVQFANLYRDGKQVQMSTRSGSFVTLRELREEVGNDAARFFYVLRKSEQHMDFDLDLAKSKTNDNPVFYIQYAHARICSVQKQSNSQFGEIDFNCDLSVLTHEHEDKLIKELNRYQEILKNSARDYEPHVLAYYLKDLAGNFHSYYNSCEFITEDVHIRNARLTLISAVKQIIFNGLSILGVSAPESM